jgi:hypothetical protein
MKDAPRVELKCHGVQMGESPGVIVKPVLLQELTAFGPAPRYYFADISRNSAEN